MFRRLQPFFLMVLGSLLVGCAQVRFGAPPRPVVKVHADNAMAILSCLKQADPERQDDYAHYARMLETRPNYPEAYYTAIASRASRFGCQG